MDDQTRLAINELICQAEMTVEWIDEIRKTWGDEGVMRRRRDMLSRTVQVARASLAPPNPDAAKGEN